MNNESETMIYRCGNPKCSNFRKEFEAMNFHALNMATGNHVHCPKCGDIAWYVRDAEPKVKA